MNPDTWGPPMWQSIHRVALGYPVTPTEFDKRTYETFYRNMGTVLPCEKCAKHYAEHMSRNDVLEHLGSRDDLFKWTVDVHNIVNRSLGKSEMSVSAARRVHTGGWVVSPLAVVAAIVAALFAYKRYARRLFR